MSREWLTCDCGEHFADDTKLEIHCNNTGHRKAVRITVTVPPVAGPADAPYFPPAASDAERQEFARDLVRDGLTEDEAAEVARVPRPADAVRPLTREELEKFVADYQPDAYKGGRIVTASDFHRLVATARASIEAQEDRNMLLRTYDAINSCDGRCGRIYQELTAYLKESKDGL